MCAFNTVLNMFIFSFLIYNLFQSLKENTNTKKAILSFIFNNIKQDETLTLKNE